MHTVIITSSTDALDLRSDSAFASAVGGRRQDWPSGGRVKRQDSEPPRVTVQWGWRYHHTGIPTTEARPGERYLANLKMYVSGFAESPYGIEWMRFESGSPVSDIVQRLPHVAFEVDDIDAALEGKQVLSPPGSPSEGVRAAMILDNDCPIELIEFSRPPQT